MLKMASQLENIISAYKTLSKIPSVAGGRLNNGGNKITATWSVRNIDKGKNTKYCTGYVLDSNLNVITHTDFGMDVSNELLSAVSPSEAYRAVIREENKKDAKKQYLEIWNKASLERCVDLTALDLHGDVYADSEFGSLDWSPDETALVYIAERKPPKSEPYIKRKGAEKPNNDGSGDPPPKKGEEYVYRQDWGEQLVGKVASVIVLFKLTTETLTILDHLPSGCMPGQVRFSPEGGSVAGVAWETEPRRLGLIFCTNRPSFIFTLTLDGVFTRVSVDGVSVRSPRYGPGGALVWLQRQTDGPHHACHQLILREREQDKPTVLIDIVARSTETCNGHSFTGIYCQALPKRCFTQDGTKLLFSTPQGEEVRSYVVDIPSGVLTDISYTKSPGSTTVLDVKSDIILATYSNLTTPGQLIVSKLSSPSDWVVVSEPVTVPPSVAAADVKYLHLQHQNSTDEVNAFSAILSSPAIDGKVPLVVIPHGGPHSSFANTYLLEPALYNMLGIATLLINYRGSVGNGQQSVYFLPKRVGDADVKDCKLSTDYVLANYNIDSKNLFLSGGSHGGFLVTHLSGQYPDVYRAVVTRNPVTDIATMFNYTDINDWCAAEAGFLFTEKGAVSEDQLLAMRRCSPLQHVEKVRAPTALMLGSGDKRVPCYQGLEWARRLKANGVETKVYMYEDNHSLSSLPAEMDQIINSANWFITHMDKKDNTQE